MRHYCFLLVLETLDTEQPMWLKIGFSLKLLVQNKAETLVLSYSLRSKPKTAVHSVHKLTGPKKKKLLYFFAVLFIGHGACSEGIP